MSQNEPIFNAKPAFVFAFTAAVAAGIAWGFGWLEDNLDFPSFMVIGLAVNALIICAAFFLDRLERQSWPQSRQPEPSDPLLPPQ